ncbi:MAG TPA: MFS transporter, partial [Acidimicrobiales bacterium]|nr:MFS transporter [Acidimicrobiales bacterium]
MTVGRWSSYNKLLISSGLSNLADGVFQIALPLVTLGVTRDPAAFATVTVALRLPWLFFALPAGALADRLDRRRTMFRVNLVRASLIGGLALALATGTETLWLLCLVGLALGVGETLFDTAAQSILPGMVDADDLSRANGNLYAVELTMNQFVGPLLGGIVVGLTATGALTGSAAAYLCAAAALALIAGSFRPERTGPPTRIRHDVIEGARYLFSHRLLRTMALLTGISNLTSTAMLTVLPLYAVEPGPMGLSEADYGILLTAAAAGAFAGSFVAPVVERAIGRARAMLIAYVLFCVAAAAPGLSASVALVGAASALGGSGAIVWNVITVSLRQRIAPDHLLGRVNAGYRLLAWGSMPLGALLAGILGDVFGVRAVFLIAGGGALLALPLLLTIVTESAIQAAEHPDDAPTDTGADTLVDEPSR